METVTDPRANVTSPLDPRMLDTRHDALLEAAVTVFARFGFRKASMDEVARAAGISRQGLYLHFADKEALFRQAVTYKLSRQLAAAVNMLNDAHMSLEARLVCACDEWSGRYIGMLGTDAADLMCASTTLAGDTLARYRREFETALANAFSTSPLFEHCAAIGIAPPELARTLHATVMGLKHSAATRDDFVRGIGVAAKMICAGVGTRPGQWES